MVTTEFSSLTLFNDLQSIDKARSYVAVLSDLRKMDSKNLERSRSSNRTYLPEKADQVKQPLPASLFGGRFRARVG